MLKIDKHSLQDIKDKANTYYREDSVDIYNEHYHTTVCFLKSTIDFLNKNGYNIEYQLPEKVTYTETTDE